MTASPHRAAAPAATPAAAPALVKHPLPQRVIHWFNAASFLFLWLTGIGIVTTAGYRVAPRVYVDALVAIFGGSTALLEAHVAVGVVWFATLSALFLVDPWGLALRFLRDLRFTRHDARWLLLRGKAELDPTVELPPQGAYNAGQKAFGWTVVAGTAVIGASGLAMWLGTGGGEVARWMVLVHLVAVGGVVAFFIVHFTMAALLAEERPALRSMLSGTVDERYARHHHGEWYEAHGAGGGEPLAGEERFGIPRAVARLLRRGWRRVASRPEQPYWSPYAAGVGLGLTVLAAFVLLGHGLGASGAFSRLGAHGLALVAPDHVAGNAYWQGALDGGLASYWLLWAMIGTLVGGFVSAALAGRLRAGVDRGALVSPGARIALAILGGSLVGFATRFTRGCTSHQALSGGALLSMGAWVFMMTVFAGGFAAAFLLRRIWR